MSIMNIGDNMKKKVILIIIGFISLASIFATTDYIRITSCEEPIFSFLTNTNNNPITYIGLGYKIERNVGISHKENLCNSDEVRMGLLFYTWKIKMPEKQVHNTAIIGTIEEINDNRILVKNDTLTNYLAGDYASVLITNNTVFTGVTNINDFKVNDLVTVLINEKEGINESYPTQFEASYVNVIDKSESDYLYYAGEVAYKVLEEADRNLVLNRIPNIEKMKYEGDFMIRRLDQTEINLKGMDVYAIVFEQDVNYQPNVIGLYMNQNTFEILGYINVQ